MGQYNKTGHNIPENHHSEGKSHLLSTNLGMWHTVVENPNNEGNDISNGFSHYGMSRQTGF